MYRKEKTGVELHVGKVIVLGNDGLRVLLKKLRREAYLLCSTRQMPGSIRSTGVQFSHPSGNIMWHSHCLYARG